MRLRIVTAVMAAVVAGDASADDALFKAGKSSFESKCAMCHTIERDAGHSVGPNLNGLLGRMVGSASGFAYSQALSQGKGEWDAAKLGMFLRHPQAFAPGSVMPFAGLKNDRERKALVCYLSGKADGAACAM